jgi:hypothetical protein
MCTCLFCVCVVLWLGRGLATSWSLVQGVVPSVKWSWNWKKNQRPEPKGAVEPVKKNRYWRFEGTCYIHIFCRSDSMLKKASFNLLAHYYSFWAVNVVTVFNLASPHEDVWFSGGITPRVFNVRPRWRWMISFMPGRLYLREKFSDTRWTGGWVGQFIYII